jgi:hypothetical protein
VVFTTNEMFEREPRLVELGSQAARWVFDPLTRERGYIKAAVGVYETLLTPVGSPPPPPPADPEFKPGIGFYAWNPIFGEVRFEANGAILVRTYDGLFGRYKTFSEAARGLVPVVEFTGRREVYIKKRGATYWAPILDMVGWVDRDKIEPFRLREPTVAVPVPFTALPAFSPASDLQQRAQEKLNSTGREGTITGRNTCGRNSIILPAILCAKRLRRTLRSRCRRARSTKCLMTISICPSTKNEFCGHYCPQSRGAASA